MYRVHSTRLSRFCRLSVHVLRLPRSFRFNVPMLHSRFSMQASVMAAVMWPEGGGECRPEPGSCSKFCLPNGVGYLPREYLMTFKYNDLSTCSHEPTSSESPTTKLLAACETTSLALTDAHGKITKTWKVMIPADVAAEWDFKTTQNYGCDFCHETPGAGFGSSKAQCDGPESFFGDSGLHSNHQQCEAYRSECRQALRDMSVPYLGSLTGIATTWKWPNSVIMDHGVPGEIYACGQPMQSDKLTASSWFLFRFQSLDPSSDEAYVEQVIPLGWLPSDPDSLGVERCTLLHQPGWGGRFTKEGIGARLFVIPKATGKLAWTAAARGCAMQYGRDGAKNCDVEDTRGHPSCDCNSKPCSEFAKVFTGRANPSCFLSMTEEPIRTIVDQNKECWLAFMSTFKLDGDKSLKAQNFWATSAVIGGNVEGMALFDNKLGENHAAIVRCNDKAWRDHCWLEFHWYARGMSWEWFFYLKNKASAVFNFLFSSKEFAGGIGPQLEQFNSIMGYNPLNPGASSLGFKDPKLNQIRLPFSKPIYFFSACPALMDRSGKKARNTLENSVPLFIPGVAQLSCSLVRAMKIPAGACSLSHDSGAGTRVGTHNYFHLSFGGGTWENRFREGALIKSRNVEQQVFLMRYPILQVRFASNAYLLGMCITRLMAMQPCPRHTQTWPASPCALGHS